MRFKQYKFIQIWNIPISDFSNWKKIRFTLKNSIFGGQKRFSDLAQNWLIWGSDDIKLLKFGTFRIPIFPIGKKSNLVFSFGKFGSKTPAKRGLFLGILVQKYQRWQAFSSFQGRFFVISDKFTKEFNAKKRVPYYSETWHTLSIDEIKIRKKKILSQNLSYGFKIRFRFLKFLNKFTKDFQYNFFHRGFLL